MAGLLGTMDDEPSTDFIFPNKTLTQNGLQMGALWELSDDQSCTPFGEQVTSESADSSQMDIADVTLLCHEAFKSRSSSLSSCFSYVGQTYH